jgi:hypothetical protein
MTFTKKIIPTEKTLREQIEQVEYKAPSRILGQTEYRRYPPFLIGFYQSIFWYDNTFVPTPEQFWSMYLKLFRNDIKDYELEGVRGRAMRSYPSLVRDYHFFILCRESSLLDKVTYSVIDDLNGVDLTLTYKDVLFKVHLYIDTVRSNYFRAIKNNRHKNLDMYDIDLPLQLIEENKVGNFYLYSQNSLNKLISLMDDIINKEVTNE